MPSALITKTDAAEEDTKLRVSVIIPIYDSLRYFVPCLASIAAAVQAHGLAELILVDNGSTDGTWERLQAEYSGESSLAGTAGAARVVLLQDAGRTVAGLRNLGASHARGATLVFLDSDCEVAPDYLAVVEASLERHACDATGSWHVNPEPPHWIEDAWTGLHMPKPGPAAWLPSGNFAVRKAAFDAVGGFRNDLLTDEDTDIGRRLRDAGFKLVEDPAVRAVHHGNPRTLGGFFRRELWHGLGSWAAGPLDKPLLASLLHLGLILGALLGLLWPMLGPRGLPSLPAWAAIPLLLAAWLAVPAAAVVYRTAQQRRLHRPHSSLLLYALYFTARVSAMFVVLWRAATGARGPVKLKS